MRKRLFIGLSLALLVFLGGCEQSSSTEQVLSKCSILGDEVKHYGRANYLRLFHAINPKKFAGTYQQVATFDNNTHRAMINTYFTALKRLKTNNKDALRLIVATHDMTHFVNNFVDNDYPKAMKHKRRSRNNPLSDDFFMEINDIVKFDANIKGFDKNQPSFKTLLAAYNEALAAYSKKQP